MLVLELRKIEWDFKKLKRHVKLHKKCRSIREKRSDIFPSLGFPLSDLALQNAGFETAEKSKGTLKS